MSKIKSMKQFKQQVADNKGDDENKPVQANPVSVETKVK